MLYSSFVLGLVFTPSPNELYNYSFFRDGPSLLIIPTVFQSQESTSTHLTA